MHSRNSYCGVQQACIFTISSLHAIAGLNTLMALCARQNMPLDAPGFQAHGTGMFARCITIDAVFGSRIVKPYDHGLRVCHPHQTLEQANSTTIAAEQVTSKKKFRAKQGSTD